MGTGNIQTFARHITPLHATSPCTFLSILHGLTAIFIPLVSGLTLSITSSKALSVLLGDYLSLNCSLTNHTSGDLTYMWTHVDTSTILQETSGILTFPRISEEELGTYRCNVLGANDDAEVNITSASKKCAYDAT